MNTIHQYCLRSAIVTLLAIVPVLQPLAQTAADAQAPAAQPTDTSADALTPEDLMKKAEQAFTRGGVNDAFAYFRQAAEAGYAPAQNRLAYLLDQAEQNAEALQWFKASADQGDAEGESGLARMYATADGVDQNNSEAVRLYTSAAGKDYLPAIRILVTAYEKGEMGLRVDYDIARQWLEKGAQQDDYWSVYRLARAYRNGELGVRIDRQRAASLEQRLAAMKKEAK